MFDCQWSPTQGVDHVCRWVSQKGGGDLSVNKVAGTGNPKPRDHDSLPYLLSVQRQAMK